MKPHAESEAMSPLWERVHPEQDLSEWASWACVKADWYDPTIAKEDELWGKREHEKIRKEQGPNIKTIGGKIGVSSYKEPHRSM